MDPWETYHRWEWFRRSQWLPSFREQRQTISLAVSELLQERDMADALLLDCSCGLGFHTIAFTEAGLQVHGADRSAFAVTSAQALAHAEGHQIPFFVAHWHDLPTQASQRYHAIFCDALSWIPTRHEMEKALQGMLGALHPGGILLFLGAPEGVTREQSHQNLDEVWHAKPQASFDWRHEEGPLQCTKMSVGSLGEDFIDRHHLFLIEEGSGQRLECVTIRESMHWNWQRLVEVFQTVGFSALSTYTERQWSSRGMSAGLNVATKSPAS